MKKNYVFSVFKPSFQYFFICTYIESWTNEVTISKRDLLKRSQCQTSRFFNMNKNSELCIEYEQLSWEGWVWNGTDVLQVCEYTHLRTNEISPWVLLLHKFSYIVMLYYGWTIFTFSSFFLNLNEYFLHYPKLKSWKRIRYVFFIKYLFNMNVCM